MTDTAAEDGGNVAASGESRVTVDNIGLTNPYDAALTGDNAVNENHRQTVELTKDMTDMLTGDTALVGGWQCDQCLTDGGDPERLVGFCRRIFTTRFRDNSRQILATAGL